MAAAAAPEPYSESEDFTWTDKAYEMIESGVLHGEVVSRDGVVTSRVWGPCPRCMDALDDRQTHNAVTNMMTKRRRRDMVGLGDPGGAEEEPYFAVDVTCACGRDHAGAPQSATGCGISFRVELAVATGSTRP